IVNPQNKLNHITSQRTSIHEVPELKDALSKLSYPKFRTATDNSLILTEFPGIDVEQIIKTLQKDKQSYIYTFPLTSDLSTNTISNLVLKQVKGGYMAFILQYIASNGDIHTQNLAKFTGTLKRYNLEGKLLSSTKLVNGTNANKEDSQLQNTCLLDV